MKINGKRKVENGKWKAGSVRFSAKRWSKKSISGFLLILYFPFSIFHFPLIYAQSGVLIPAGETKPNPKTLALAAMNVDVTIDNRHATVRVSQIFESRAARVSEGKYVFALTPRASISDFAVWDKDQRIPGVMMERRRAERVYEAIKQPQTDPGILETTGDDESAGGFSAKIFPIDAYGTKRLEMEYAEDLQVENLQSHFAFPLKPSYGERQTVGDFDLKIRVLDDFEFAPIERENAAYPLQVLTQEPREFVGEFRARDIELGADFSFDYETRAAENSLSLLAHRAPERVSAFDLRDPKLAERSADGFFEAQALFAQNPNPARQPKRVVLLLDTSLSMYGDRLARAVEAVDFFLHSLAPEDEFNLILFGDEADSLAAEPVKATAENVEEAMAFVKNSSIGGGTNLKRGLQTAVERAEKFADGERQIVLISDGAPTLETTREKEIERVFAGHNDIKLFAFGVGANDFSSATLLQTLAEKTRGFADGARETEDIALKLKIFFDKIGATDISNLRLAPDANLYDVYSVAGENSFFGSNFAFVGRYKKPQKQTFDFAAQFGAEQLNLTSEIDLPELDEAHDFLPRVWARARVDALLRAMDAGGGEREDYISEIIQLSEKYKFVTPYTAFLAAPRALLRPRLIQPGDPVIRVKADASVKSIVAVLPFGETLPLEFLSSEKVWEARFLAPVSMADGAYKCRLLLTDEAGGGYEEEKTFVIDSRAPRVRIDIEKRIFRAGEKINLRVAADADTNRLTARLYGAKPVALRWSNEEKANVGALEIPENLASGKYSITVAAEDFAHNQTTEEATIEVLEK